MYCKHVTACSTNPFYLYVSNTHRFYKWLILHIMSSLPSGDCPLMSDTEQMEASVFAERCLGICEHGVCNCHSGLRWLTSVEYKLPGFFYVVVFQQSSSWNQRFRPKQSGRQELRHTARLLFSVHSEREDPSSPPLVLISTVPTMQQACFGLFG